MGDRVHCTNTTNSDSSLPSEGGPGHAGAKVALLKPDFALTYPRTVMLPFHMPITGSYLFLSLCPLYFHPSVLAICKWVWTGPNWRTSSNQFVTTAIQGTPRQTKQFLCVRNCWLCNPNCGNKLSSCRIRVGEEGGNLFFWTTNLYLHPQ